MQRGSDWYKRAEAGISSSLVYDWPNVPIERAAGAHAYGPNGEDYLDFVSGMASCNIGHCHPQVVAAIQEQAAKLVHGPMGVLLYEPIVELAEQLAQVTPTGIDAFFFSNSGAEAVEGALKLARYVTGRPAIVSFTGAFHGRTLGAVSVSTSKAKYRKHYEPLLGGVYQVPYPYCFRCPNGGTSDGCGERCFGHIQDLFDHRVEPSEIAAFIIEPVLGEGGYAPAPENFLKRLREVCDRHGIMLIFDEVQTGFGRTGTMFAAQGYGVRPDIMAIAKGIASGLPLSATCASRELMAKWTAGAHGTTFGGNPVACAASLATIAVLRGDGLLERVRALGERAMSFLTDLKRKHAAIGDVRGRGLMIGIEFVDPRDGKTPNGGAVEKVLKGCFERGLIVYPAGTFGQVIRFIPPLTVTDEELEKGLAIFAEAVAAL
ncbi:MAG: aspartate aminotransferase family protein [Chloroflexota bacterium]